ncbi:MAG: SurA N-terminal domain-containing protein [Thermodesulfobacteriota bacterium]
MSLNFIRNTHAWFIRGILILIVITFIIGIGYRLSNFGSITRVPQRSAAEVNGEQVSIVNFYLLRDSLKRQFSQKGDIPQEYLNQINVIALNNLINFKLLAQEAKALGFKVTDQELDSAIRSDPNFQIDGKFVGSERYKQFVQQAFKQDVGEFENSYRENLLAQKLANFVDETTLITDENLFNDFKRENDKINLYYIAISGNGFINSYTPGEEEIKQYYQKHKSEFKTPETRKIRYFTLSPDSFEKNVTVTDEEISSYYNAYPEEFQSADGKLRPLSDVTKDVESKLKTQKGEALRQQFMSKLEKPDEETSNIDSLAMEYSAGSISESKPFSLTDNMADIPPAVTRQVFSTGKGHVSIIPIGTIIWVTETEEIAQPREKSLDEAKEQAVQAIKLEKSNLETRKKSEEMLQKLKLVKKETLPAEAKKLGLELKETGFFSRSEPVPHIDSQQLTVDAFEMDPKSGVSNKIYKNGDVYYIVSIKEIKGADPEEFNKVKDVLRDQELQKQRSQVIQKMIQDLRRKAQITPNSELFPSKG